MNIDISFSFDFCDMSNEDIIEIFNSYDDVNAIDDMGDTLLLWACKAKNINIVKYALSRKANPNYLNECGEAPIHEVINDAEDNEEQAVAIIEHLIESGADLELRAYMDKTPFLKACSRNSIRIIELLARRGVNTKATVEDCGKLLDGNFYAHIFAESEEVKLVIERLVHS